MVMASSAMLPPVSEALSLLDTSFVNNEWHGTPANIRRSLQILVDHISVQSVQLSRVEDILTAFGSPSSQGGTVWSKLAGKADLNRLEKLEEQVDGLLNESALLRSQQSAASLARDDMASRLELLKDQMNSLEARLGLPYASDSSTAGIDQYGGPRRGGSNVGGFMSPNKRGALVAAGALVVPSVQTGSILDRIARLERRADTLAQVSARTEDESALLLGKMREMEPRLEVQLNHLRGDIKQALAAAAASTKQEAEAESACRLKESEKRLLARIQSVESALENKVSALSTQAGITISTELDKRVNGVYDHVDLQVQRLRGDLDRFSREKVDLGSLEHYSQRISALFESIAQGLADEVAAVVGQMRAELATVTRDAAAAQAKDQALHDTIRSEMDVVRQLSGQVKEAITTVQESVTANPRLIEDTRNLVRQTMADSEQLQKAVAGLNTAMASTSSALELQSHKLGQLSHRLSGMQQDLGNVKDMLYGGAAKAAAAVSAAAGDLAGAGGASSAGCASLLSKLASLDRAITDINTQLSAKTEEAQTRELERRIAAMARQQDVTSEGLRSLSSTAFKRSDEHASAIQRLTLAVSGNLEERPTSTAVKHMIETAALEVRERCDSALAPLWDAVRILQSGLRDAAGELKALGSNLSNLQQAQNDTRSKGASDRASVMAALRKALDEEVGTVRMQLEARMEGMESGVRQAAEQLEVHAQLQDRLTRLTEAVEEQLATQVAAWRAGNQQLRNELAGRVESATSGLSVRLEAVEGTCKRHSEELQVVAEASSSKLGEAAVRDIVNAVSRTVAKQEVGKLSEKHEAKWKEWLEEHGQTHEHLATHDDVATVVDSTSRQVKQELDGVISTRTEELRRTFASLRGEVDGRTRATTSRMEVLELRVQDLGSAVESCASKKDVEDLAVSAMSQRAERAGLETRVRQLSEEVEDQASALSVLRGEAVTRSELTAELARKVDLATYLAHGSARAAAASASVLVGSSASGPSPPRRPPQERVFDTMARAATGTGAAAAARAVERLQLGSLV
ncbi:hypothetical protein Agub_g14444 [Astrephomene gubernaculifera]|uniref:Uncharacterized protein n=1 Tax=Astrephomene gubernaculifera TaxID=47775 RepID=A0AAD3E1K0_9CHLO|nr:hypothetical protein Agub_g14444 [Astrephomene gubernaculifera]